MEELISVIVPVYNAEKFLEKCIYSIVNQTYKNLEIILINDGSRDDSLKICNQWAEKDSRIIIVDKINEGVSKTRNKGLDISKGKYVSFIDSDDYLNERFFELLINKAKQDDSDLVICRYNKVFEDIKVKDTENIEEFVNTQNLSLLVQDKGKVNAYLCRCLFKKEILKKYKYSEEIKYLEDLYLFLQILSTKPKISFVNKFLYNYVIHQNSLCNKIDKDYCLKYEQGAIKCSEQFNKIDKELEGKSLLFGCYLIALKQGVLLKDKYIISEFSNKYNTSSYYKAYKVFNKSFKSKLKAFLARYKLILLYKILLKFNKS